MADYGFFPPSGGGGGSSTLTGRAGEVSIGNGSQTVSVTFTSAFSSTNYAISWSITNTTDSSPIFLQGFTSAKSTTGFTVTFNAPTDSANYVLEYLAAGNV